MSNDSNSAKMFQDFAKALEILDKPRFTLPDAVAVTGATAKAIEHMADPKQQRVQLSGEHATPGHGRRRLFTGGDILKLEAAHKMGAVGFPVRWSNAFTDLIFRRAKGRIIGTDIRSNMIIVTYPLKGGDWACVPIYGDEQDEPALPVAVQMLQADRMIDETLAKLRAILADEPIPDFAIPPIEPEPSPWSPENDVLGRWAKEVDGSDVLVGLSRAETLEFERLKDLWLVDRSQTGKTQQVLISDDQNRRLRELEDRHRRAQMKRNFPDAFAEE